MGVPPIEQTRRDLLTAWRGWDDNPAHPGAAAKVEVAFGNHATHFGLRTTPFRSICSAYRHARFTREQTLDAIENGLGVRTTS